MTVFDTIQNDLIIYYISIVVYLSYCMMSAFLSLFLYSNIELFYLLSSCCVVQENQRICSLEAGTTSPVD